MSIQTIDPSTNTTLKTFDSESTAEIDALLDRATRAFEEWRITPLRERAELLHRVANGMREKRESLSKLITQEMGKLIGEAQMEVDLSADIFDYYADHAAEFLADEPLSPERGQAFVRKAPLGVLLGIEPWNFPFYQVARFAAPNLALGNVVVVKLASNVPQCAIALQRLFDEASAPPGVYTNLLLAGRDMASVVADERVKGVSLTGSDAAGASVAAEAGKAVKKVVLELGGSDPLIVLEDADLDRAVDWAVVGRMNNTGQCCVASKRIIVDERIADAFLEKLGEKLAALKVGDPSDPTTELGPLSSEQAAQTLEDQVQRSVQAGALLVLGGHRIQRPGAYFEATILTDIQPGTPAYQEEMFGPVVAFFRVRGEDEAIALANDTPYGLGASVFTRDVERAKRVADQLDTGMVFINHPTWTTPDLPFGGTKRSGYGRELSRLGTEEFVNKKLIRISALDDPF